MCLVATKEGTAGPGSQDDELCGLWKLSNRAQFGQFWVKKRVLSHVWQSPRHRSEMCCMDPELWQIVDG